MRLAARLGSVFALAWLVLLWPPVAAFFHLALPAWRAAALLATLAAYAAVYAFFCFRGYRCRQPWFVAAEVAVLTLLAGAVNALSGLKTPNPYVIPTMVAGFAFAPVPAVAAIVLLAAFGLTDSLVGAGFTAQEDLATILVIGPQLLLWGAGAMGLRYLVDVLAELRAAREQIGRLAVEQERARISRDLHDQLGHSLSLLTLKGELAARLIPSGAPGGAEVRDMVGLARDALREVREVVSGYRKPTLATELSAARTALAAAGIGCDVEQSVGAVSRETEAVLGWAIREGVTNVIRHSRAAHCRIALVREDGLVRADVVDDGVGADGAAEGSGLRGLGERVGAIGGRLETGRGPGRGFRLTVAAPAGGAARDGTA
ncbi:MAG TPA: sensor histidine kinase [Terriglobales bacterium]|nr:sensor histidine kinase [Terriglobales bacterium]